MCTYFYDAKYVLKSVLCVDGNSSEEEEGAIGSSGTSKVMSETVRWTEDSAHDEQEMMRIMGFSGFDSTKVRESCAMTDWDQFQNTIGTATKLMC
jgi:hypothetical protein